MIIMAIMVKKADFRDHKQVLRLEHPDNERFQRMRRPIIKEKIFRDADGNLDVAGHYDGEF